MWTDYKVKTDTFDEDGSFRDILEGTRLQEEKILESDRLEKELKAKAILGNTRSIEDYNFYDESATNNDTYDKLNKAENSLVTECMMKLYEDSYVGPVNNRIKTIAKNLIGNFVNEQGAHKLIKDWYSKNYVLSEFSRICEKHYNKLLEEELERDENGFPITKSFNIDTEPTTDFFQDIEDIDYSDASKMIHDRVSDAITDFMDENISTKMDYQDIIDSAKDQIDSVTSESSIAFIKEDTEGKISDIESNREKNMYQLMVEALAKKSFSDAGLKQRYLNENSSLDMDSIVDSVQSIYHFLELCNTMNIAPMNDNDVLKYLANL